MLLLASAGKKRENMFHIFFFVSQNEFSTKLSLGQVNCSIMIVVCLSISKI